MALLSTEKRDHTLYIVLCERIDANNIDEIKKEIDEAIEDESITFVTADAKNLAYISSIGLREIMRLKKRFRDLKIIHVSDEVYDIFDLTKFTDIIQVEREHRVISVEGCPVLGKGAAGTVYKLDDETIVKVFGADYAYNKIERERDNSRNAFFHGVDTAIPFDIVRVGENFGLIYEIINADTLKNVMLRDRGNLAGHMTTYAMYVKDMHRVVVDEPLYPDMKKGWIEKIKSLEGVFSDNEKGRVIDFLEKIPDKRNFVHGDVNFGNFMVSNGKALVIDMEDVVLGDPVFDVSFIYYLISILPELLPAELCEMVTGFTAEENALMWKTFSNIYFDISTEEERRRIEKKLYPYASIKLLEVMPWYYSILRNADDSIKQFVPKLYDAFRDAEKKHKAGLMEAMG